MGLSKFLGKFFGGFLILLALFIIFTGLFAQYSIGNIDVLAESAETKLPEVMEENKDVFAEALFKEQKITKAQLSQLCREKPGELPKDFCIKLKTMAEEEVKEELVSVMILKIQEEFKPKIQGLEQNIKSRAGEVLKYLNYVVPLGVIVFLLGSLLVFLAEKFKWKDALFHISLKIGVVSAFVAVGNYFMKNFTPEKLESLTKTLPLVQEQASGFAIKVMSEILIDWIKIVSVKMFLVSIIIAIVSLSIALITFILRRKKKRVKKPEVKKKEKSKVPVAKKKVLFSKKK